MLSSTFISRLRTQGLKYSDILLTDTVGFIQKIPVNLVAAFRATIEEVAEADILIVSDGLFKVLIKLLMPVIIQHVVDATNDAWRKQEAAVLRELNEMVTCLLLM
jgi:50S ribosomal subunit-associated GTPase HflX